MLDSGGKLSFQDVPVNWALDGPPKLHHILHCNQRSSSPGARSRVRAYSLLLKTSHEIIGAIIFQTNFEYPQRSGISRQNSRGIPALPFEAPRNKISREGMNFSTSTPSRGRPPPHSAVSGPQKLWGGERGLFGLCFPCGLSTKCLDKLFNRTRNPSEPYTAKAIAVKKSFEAVAL